MQNPQERSAQTFQKLLEAQANAELAAQAAAQVAQGSDIARLRDAIRRELATLEERRDEISGQLQSPMVEGANRAGLERRIVQLDTRIASLESQAAEVDASLARAGGVSGVQVNPAPRIVDAEDLIAIPVLLILCVALPLTIAFARRIWRRSGEVASSIPNDLADRLARIDRNLDAVALEVERIGEAQRFLTRSHAEQQRGLPGAPPEPALSEREKDWQRRG